MAKMLAGKAAERRKRPLSLAAAAGEPTAKELIQVYSTRMEPEQVAEARSLAQEWLSQKRAS